MRRIGMLTLALFSLAPPCRAQLRSPARFALPCCSPADYHPVSPPLTGRGPTLPCCSSAEPDTPVPSTRAADTVTAPCCSPSEGNAPVSRARMVVGGVLGGLAGFAGGGLLGGWLDCRGHPQGEQYCGEAGVLAGGGLGELIGVPLGVHLANHRHGRFLWDVLASTGSAFGLSVLLGATRSDAVITVGALALPVIQAGAAAYAEERTTR